MSRPPQTIKIDRLILDGLNVTPDHARRIRRMVEIELGHRLNQEGWAEHPAAREVTRLDAGSVLVPTLPGDVPLARGIARQVAQTLSGVARA